ncbi:MAG TPA: DUF6599 family protein [Pyrinomonadaceae bacterium]
MTLRIIRSSSICFVLLLLLCAPANATSESYEAAAKLLPERLANFKAVGNIRFPNDGGDVFNGTAVVARDYQSPEGDRFTVQLFTTTSDSGAYARLTRAIRTWFTDKPQEVKLFEVGTLGYVVHGSVYFYKGPAYVSIEGRDRRDDPKLLDFARRLAESLDKGEGEIPALVKHLPYWETRSIHPAYAVQLAGLKEDVPNQPVLDAIKFDGGVEAVSANYDRARLVIVEFTTPQLATENDRATVAKLSELRAQGQATPTAYRRVGNYGVFVFDAPSEAEANQLIDQVKYQQVVQWLGENPFSYEKATREFTETTLGVLVSVVKASGIALVSCLAIGGFAGALLFNVRRSQQRAKEAYADSEAMLRLNIDELTPEKDSTRLLGSRH